MSHVTVIDIEIKDLAALRKACADLGLEFREGQTTFKWYGRQMGDYPIPDGYTKADMGKCEHAIGIPNNKDAYEVGVVKNRKTGGWHLMWDFFAGGKGLQAAVGNNCGKLTQEYAKHVALKECYKLKGMGFHQTQQKNAAGEHVILLRRA